MFSELVVAYLFLGGTGAGALLIAAVLMLLADERAVSRGVVVLSLIHISEPTRH